MKHFAVLAISTLLSLSAVAADKTTVEGSAFRFDLPKSWKILNQGEDADFWTAVFYNSRSDVAQLAVSKNMDPLKYRAAKRNLKSGMGKDKTDQGWALKKSGVVSMPPYHDVDEEIYLATTGDLTMTTYAVYGNKNIAIFTFTLNRNEPDIARAVHPLLFGLQWK